MTESSVSPHHHPLPRVIAIANQKGGVGKTTTSVNLSACLAELGFRTLLIDLDPQGNASSGVGIETRGIETSIYDVLLNDAAMEDCVEPASVKNLFVAPANLDLAGAEIELVNEMAREHRLKKAIDQELDRYDYIIIDCPPSLGLLTVNALVAAREVLVPIQCEYYALEGLGQSKAVVDQVREHFGDKVCNTMVPRDVRLSEAPSHHQPINLYDPSSKGCIAYRSVAKEVSGGTSPRTR